ncbi:uncharacterized protein LOC132748271, partial [Ruditapes philippinarum]|uniref:uncharacterized protein LOC132748271 n=1 Tax=Ruditapes philippinarum TaxID=129788 RepID=UPI00295B2B23
MNKRPMTILGFNIDVDVYRDKIYSESEHAERDVQGPESLQTTGESITSKRDSIGREKKGAETSSQINDKQNDTLTEEPTKIKLSRVSVDMNRSMLKRFFENVIDFGGKVVEVTVNSKESSAIVTFDTSAAVYEIMDTRPLTILGFKVDVDVY